ncbi:MAG: hypothetical protein ACRCT0_04735, partial [Plesiomonas shigelloides]
AHLTLLMGELVTALRGLQGISAAPSAVFAAASPRLSFPEKLDGDGAKCKGFLMQCSLFVTQ